MADQAKYWGLFVSIGLYLLRDLTACAAPDIRARAGADLLRLALAHHFVTDPGDWRLGRADTGARIVTAGPIAAPTLSLAHSGDLLVVAVVDNGPIGVDIERLRRRRYTAIAHHLGWPSSLWAQAGMPTQDEFLHLWTLWEALFKSMPHATFADVRGAFKGQAGHVRAGVAGLVRTDTWSGRSWHCPGRYWLSVVARPARMPEIALFRVDRLAGDVESARIQTIKAPEGELHL